MRSQRGRDFGPARPHRIDAGKRPPPSTHPSGAASNRSSRTMNPVRAPSSHRQIEAITILTALPVSCPPLCACRLSWTSASRQPGNADKPNPARQDRSTGTSQDGRAMVRRNTPRRQDGRTERDAELDSFQPNAPTPRLRPVPARSSRRAARTQPPAKGSSRPSSDHPAWLPARILDQPPATSTKTRSMRTPPTEHRAITIRSSVVPAERHPSVPAVWHTAPSGSDRKPQSAQPIKHFDSFQPHDTSVDPASDRPTTFKHTPRSIETLHSPHRPVPSERFQAFHRADLSKL